MPGTPKPAYPAPGTRRHGKLGLARLMVIQDENIISVQDNEGFSIMVQLRPSLEQQTSQLVFPRGMLQVSFRYVLCSQLWYYMCCTVQYKCAALRSVPAVFFSALIELV